MTLLHHLIYPPPMDSTFDLDIDWFESFAPMDAAQTTSTSESHLEVGDDFTQPEDASSLAVSMPHFLETEPSLGPAYIDTPRSGPNPWPPKLIFDLALGQYTQEEILESHGLTERQFDRMMDMPVFRQELAAQIREQRENGASYAAKAKVQAETYLLDIDDIVRDREVAAGVRLEAIKYTTKVAGLEPKETKGDNGATATSVNLQINFT